MKDEQRHEMKSVGCLICKECGGEGPEKPDMSHGRKYVAGSSFYDKARYPKLA